MTTTDIIAYADPERLATPDMDLEAELRYNIVPDFLEEVGYASWRRKVGSAVISAGDRSFTLPADFYSMMAITPGDSTDQNFEGQLTYVGDNPKLMMQAEAATTRNAIGGYYYTRITTPNVPHEMRIVNFTAPSDKSYTLRFVYYAGVVFTDTVMPYDFSDFVPMQHQWALVEWLKKVIYERRYGVGDQRAQSTEANLARKMNRASTNLEKTNTERPRFVN